MTVKMLSCVAGSLVFCTGLSAVTVETTMPYQGIVDRNVFGLKPPPPPPDPEANKPPPPKITLTGITSILGHKQALMKTPPPVAKAGEQSKGEQSYILCVGERQGDIEVLDIDEAAATVKVNNGGQVYTLSLDKDGPKPSAGTAPAPLPGGTVPPTGFGAPAPPGGNGFTPPPAPGGNFNMPVRPTRTSLPGVTSGNSYTPAASGGFGAPAASFGGYGGTPVAANVGNGGFGFGGTPATPTPVAQQQQQQPALTPEQQIVMLEAQREYNRNNPDFPPLPPTPLNPEPTGTANPNPNQNTTPPTPNLPPRPVGYGPPPVPGR